MEYPVPTYKDLYYIFKNNNIIGEAINELDDISKYKNIGIDVYLAHLYAKIYESTVKILNKLGYSTNFGYDHFVNMLNKVNMLFVISDNGAIITF